jgi:predicted secreted protein
MSTLITEKPATLTTTKAPGNPDLWVYLGKPFDIKLDEDPSNGYIWALAHLPENFYLLADSYEPHQPIEIGKGGIRQFTFVAMKLKTEGNIIFYDLSPADPFTPLAESTWCVRVH